MRRLKIQSRDNSVSDRGQRAVVEILSAARDVLVDEGHAKLTMRNVAKRAGMTVGNLSYYYANKQNLLHDLLEAVIQGYVEDFDRIAEDPDKSAEERLADAIRFVVTDLATKETTAFFPALWALANHDDFAAQEMENIYAVERGIFARLIREMRPDLKKKDCDLLALFVSASIEGQTMFVGYRRKHSGSINEIANIAAYSLINLVRTADAEIIRGLKPAAKPKLRRIAS